MAAHAQRRLYRNQSKKLEKQLLCLWLYFVFAFAVHGFIAFAELLSKAWEV